jgi:hypothetical protein
MRFIVLLLGSCNRCIPAGQLRKSSTITQQITTSELTYYSLNDGQYLRKTIRQPKHTSPAHAQTFKHPLQLTAYITHIMDPCHIQIRASMEQKTVDLVRDKASEPAFKMRLPLKNEK